MMKFVISSYTIFTVFILGWMFFALRYQPVEMPDLAHSNSIPNTIYVWQRRWDDPVTTSLQKAAKQVDGFTVLGAEISFDDQQPRLVRVKLDYAALLQSHRPVGIALRIGPYSGPFETTGTMAEFLTSTAKSIVQDARQNGLDLEEFQIDFDCAESKLQGYKTWIELLRKQVSPIPLTITALPSWLRHKAFSKLVHATDGFVLQVHSLQRPEHPTDTISLCDPIKARTWIAQAAKTQVLFRVALPTYGYLVTFDEQGRFKGLSAEGPSRSWKKGMTLQKVMAHPWEMATLVAELQSAPPNYLHGIIWYRLPVAGDHLNWPWPTLTAVMQGRLPREQLEIQSIPDPDGLVEIFITNTGEVDAMPGGTIHLRWQDSHLQAADGLHGFVMESQHASTLQLQDKNKLQSMAPGETWTIAWLRFDSKTEVTTYVQPTTP